MSKRYTSDRKKELVGLFRKSRLTKQVFCMKHNISESTLYRILNTYAPELTSNNTQYAKPRVKKKFIPIIKQKEAFVIPSEEFNSQQFMIQIADKVQIKFPVGFDVTYLKDLVGAITK